jgi:(E)-4-hydroxy-3-methylbut-2-enyl-diphosphate synthase
MGCVVNGPGEAKEADIGIAFGKSAGMLFKHGKAVRKVALKDVVKTLCREIACFSPGRRCIANRGVLS